MRIVDGPGRDHETVAGLYLEGRLTIDQDFALAFDYVADLFTGMGVASGGSARRNRDARDDRLVTSRDVLGLDDGSLDAGVLGEERAYGYDSQDGPLLD